MERVSLKTYAVMNVVFWAYCGAMYVVLRLWLHRITGFAPLFVALGVGFTLVCAFDTISDFLSRPLGEWPKETREDESAETAVES
ncbi:hypothetical protein JW916_03060 [Candidatus Sumerlaeota bacterium]|nr:hypothetical protein [Candidatus Sumerlaeota bacterium]